MLSLSLLIVLPLPLTAAASQQEPPMSAIAISLNMAEGNLTATERITLPADIPLTLSCGPLLITGAVLETGGRTPRILRTNNENIITIPAAAGEQTVYVSWSLTVSGSPGSDNLISSRGVTLAGFWHPLPNRDMLYRLQAELPDGFTGICEAETMSIIQTKKNRTFSGSFAHPLRTIHFVAGPYTVRSRTLAGGIILSTYFFPEDSGLAPDYLDKASAYIKRYQDLIGPYPYKQFSIVENRLPTGYGMPTFTLLGQTVVRLPFIKDTSLGHEILHSWFGNGIRTSKSDGNWCEGLTTYLADQMYAEDKNEGPTYRKNQLLRYISYVHSDNTMNLEDFSNAGDSQPMARMIRTIGYDKGSMMFHMLRKKVGDSAFYKGLKNFYAKMRFKRADWHDIESSFEAATKADLVDFFDQWLTRTDVPVITVGHIDINQEEGRSHLSFTLKQNNIRPYDLSVPVRVITRAEIIEKNIHIDKLESTVDITMDDLPLELVIDPDYDVMRALDEEEIYPAWSRFIGAKKRTVVISEGKQSANYTPLLNYLKHKGCDTIAAKNLKNSALGQGSYLFLGPSPQSLGLFADPKHAQSGLTIDVHANPLNPRQVIVLVFSSSVDETAAALRKLSHYGKYGFLFFKQGRISRKHIPESTRGIHYTLMTEPEGEYVADMKSFNDIIAQLAQSRVVYVGEQHTDYGSHLLQLRIIQALFQADPHLAIGMEMFPRSSQDALDGYINGTIKSEKEFLKKSKYFSSWGYDYRLYREIIAYARLHGIPLVGLNLEKTIVSRVFRDGNLDGLSAEQMNEIAPDRDLDVPGYRDRLISAFSAHKSGDKAELFGGFLQAQSIWDETMAQSIVEYLKAHPDRKMVILAGTGHVYKDSAIPLRVKRRLQIRQSVVTSRNFGDTGRTQGRRIDFLLNTQFIRLKPAQKIGLLLKVETNEQEPNADRVRIIGISPHGKAGKAGVKKNDIVLAVNGRDVHSIEDLKIELVDKQPGDSVTLKVRRENMLLPDKELELKVKLSSMTMTGIMPPGHPR